MTTGTEWMARPKTITEGEYDKLAFALDRLNAMRNVVRGMMAFEQDYAVPPKLRSLLISLTSMVRVDDAEEEQDDDTPLHDEAGHPVDSLCCGVGCGQQAVGWSEGHPYCATHYRSR